MGFARSTTPFSARDHNSSRSRREREREREHYISGISDDEGVSTVGKGRRHTRAFGRKIHKLHIGSVLFKREPTRARSLAGYVDVVLAFLSLGKWLAPCVGR